MRILDRYILKNFLIPFLYCFLGFIAMWLAFDLAYKTNDLLTNKITPQLLLAYYATQLPQYVVFILPVALLLALLFSLSRMSRSNEIISMLSSGMSLYRLVVPLVLVGVAVAGASFAMNYEMAPHAEASKSMLEGPTSGGLKFFIPDSLLFRNRADLRTWLLTLKTNQFNPYERAAHIKLDAIQAVHITQQDKDGNILCKYYAHSILFDPASRTWTFTEGKTVNFNLTGDVTTEEDWDTLKIKDWSETPWRLFSTNLDAANLSVPELRNYLRYNSDFPESQLAAYRCYYYYRWAVPASCLVIVLIASPLGIVYSRRGVLAGVATSIFIFFGTIFFDKFLLALGKHGSIPPVLAAWGTDIIFGAVGLGLLYMRAGNRDITKFHPKNLLHFFKQA